MERKTKHRILGAVVIIGLVIILLPLFQHGKELSSDTAIAKAPPFPDQSVQVNVAPPSQAEAEQGAATQAQSAPGAPTVENNTVNQQPDDTISMNHPSIVNAKVPDITPNANATATPQQTSADSPSDIVTVPLEQNKDDKITELAPASGDELMGDSKPQTTAAQTPVPDQNITAIKTAEQAFKQTPALKQASNTVAAKKMTAKKALAKRSEVEVISMEQAAALTHAPLSNNGLLSLKNAAWVIQLGSFKNKANALRLVNQLRASGYRAFIQQVSNTAGQNTRVYVGPENKIQSARALADRLQSDLHMRGIVISYQPLSL